MLILLAILCTCLVIAMLVLTLRHWRLIRRLAGWPYSKSNPIRDHDSLWYELMSNRKNPKLRRVIWKLMKSEEQIDILRRKSNAHLIMRSLRRHQNKRYFLEEIKDLRRLTRDRDFAEVLQRLKDLPEKFREKEDRVMAFACFNEIIGPMIAFHESPIDQGVLIKHMIDTLSGISQDAQRELIGSIEMMGKQVYLNPYGYDDDQEVYAACELFLHVFKREFEKTVEEASNA